MSQVFTETAEQAKRLKTELSKLKDKPGPLMMALQKAQDIYGYLPIEVQSRIAEFFQVPMEDLYGVTTFYSQFNLAPIGKYKVSVCLGTACYVKGASPIADKVKEITGLSAGETAADGKYSFEATRCIGCCGLAPVMTVNDDVYGKVTAASVKEILEKYK